jgi:uncharacterized protein
MASPLLGPIAVNSPSTAERVAATVEPTASVLLHQNWHHLLFLHWEVPPAELQALLPAGLDLDTFEGKAYVGLVPFTVSGVRPVMTPPLPWISSFHEINVRTYVHRNGSDPGVWFFSLDASSRLAVEVARRMYKLPYFHARMSAAQRGEWIDYECARIEEPGRVFSAGYRPTGAVFHAQPGSLEWFLMERYCLYTTDDRGALQRADIHHELWPLQAAEAVIELASVSPLALDGVPVCHFSRRQDVLVWPLEPIR